jgi:hypothetical protein
MEKNIWLLPTDKPSRLHTWVNNKGLRATLYEQPQIEVPNTAKNLYITNDEEIKERDWYIYAGQINKRIRKNPNAEYLYPNYKKIILTTDQDLIKEGIQEMPTDFLEWLVKNPSCESVCTSYGLLNPFQSDNKGYMIHCPDNEATTIPQDQPKHNCCTPIGQVKRYTDCVGCDNQPKQTNWLDANPNCKQVESCSNSLSGKCVCPKQTIEDLADKYDSSAIWKCGESWKDGYNHAQKEIEELKRKFTGSCTPVASPLGKVLMNSKESKLISKAIQKLIRTGNPTQVSLSLETQNRIKQLITKHNG